MKHQIMFALGMLWVGIPSASASVIEIDFITLQSGSDVIFGDDFNDELFSAQWTVLAGDPGPETGTTLEMRTFDWMGLTLANPNPGADLTVRAVFDLVSGGVPIGLVFHAVDPLDSVSLVFLPDSGVAFVIDENGELVVETGVALGSVTALDMQLTTREGGVVGASVNGQSLFQGVTTDLGPITGFSIFLIPEPVTLALMAAGLVMLWPLRRTRHHWIPTAG